MAALQSDGGERQGMADRKQVAINKNAATRINGWRYSINQPSRASNTTMLVQR